METGSPAAAISAPKHGKDGPLPPLLLVLTMITGLVDAVSYLELGHVFVANMTGNIVFLGFAAAGAPGLSVPASLAAIGAFLAGALAGGRLALHFSGHRGRFLAIASYIMLALIGAALLVSIGGHNYDDDILRYALIVLLALAMGLQNAAVRRLSVSDLTTTVLTLTLTGIAADSRLAGGTNPNVGRRLAGTATMLAGAAVGAVLIRFIGVSAVLALVFALLAVNAIVAYRLSSSTDAWTGAN